MSGDDGAEGGEGGGGGACSRDYRERLIEEVRRRPALYDTSHDRHKDNEHRERCWADIATAIGENSEVVKHDWKILRDSLRQCLRMRRAGAPRTWRYYARMAFVLPYMTQRGKMRPAVSDRTPISARPRPPADGGVAAPGEDEGGGTGGEEGSADALELFFAAACAATRRLGAARQRRVQRALLDALHRAAADDDDTRP